MDVWRKLKLQEVVGGRGKDNIKMDFTEWGNDGDINSTELLTVSLRLCGNGTKPSQSIPLYQRVLKYCTF
jgi:hypothetical protein